MFLITGANGFVGQRLTSYLLAQNLPFRVLTRTPIPEFDNILCDFTLDSIPSNSLDSVHTIFHLAAIAHNFSVTREQEDLYRSVNLNAAVSLAEKAVQKGVHSFVFVSSIKAGGPALAKHCMTESDHDKPNDIYGKTKREAELRLLEIGENSDLKVSIIRPTLVYGPKVKGNLSRMVSLLNKGCFPPLPDVGNRRSMIHVDDLVRAIFFLGTEDENDGEIYIATDGLSYSSREIYNLLCHSLGRPAASWAVPKFFFDLVGFLNSPMKRKFNKLFGDAYYSSEKLQSIGFRPQLTLREMNETLF